MSTTTIHPPLLLIASHHAEAGLALKELGEKNGYTVLRCFTATQALERARAGRPDVIVLDESLLDVDALDTSRALRDDPLIGASTPILLVTAARPRGRAVPRTGAQGEWPPLRRDRADRSRGVRRRRAGHRRRGRRAVGAARRARHARRRAHGRRAAAPRRVRRGR